jgi:hypothetical protein
VPPQRRGSHRAFDEAGDFHWKVFGFQDAETRKTRDHVSRHMTDGQIDFTLMKYDKGTRSAESKAAGDGPTPSWKKYIHDNQLEESFRTGAEPRKSIAGIEKQLREQFQQAGIKVVR